MAEAGPPGRAGALMRILLVAFFFPPANSIGAVRAGKLARFLRAQGHDVRVLTVRDTGLPAGLDQEFPETLVTRTGWIDVNRLPRLMAGEARAAGAVDGGGEVGRVLARAWRGVLNLPDPQVGWLPAALRAGSRLVESWRPELILASAGPFTGLVAAARLARRAGAPWVADLRDLWAGNAYADLPAWRRWLDSRVEARTLASAAGLVTVSAPLAAELRRRYPQPVAEILNGFDPADYPRGIAPAEDGILRIAHAGIIYPGRRDPTPLFRAVASLGEDAESVRLLFYGRLQGNVASLAESHGVGHLVEMAGPLPYRDSLAAQMAADVLLLLMWRDPREEGVLTGKLFEYLGARRPILVLGYGDGAAGRLVRERKAGVTLNDEAAIAAQLRRWLAEKRSTGRVAALPEAVGAGLTRDDQFARLMDFIATLPAVVARRPPVPAEA